MTVNNPTLNLKIHPANAKSYAYEVEVPTDMAWKICRNDNSKITTQTRSIDDFLDLFTLIRPTAVLPKNRSNTPPALLSTIALGIFLECKEELIDLFPDMEDCTSDREAIDKWGPTVRVPPLTPGYQKKARIVVAEDVFDRPSGTGHFPVLGV